MIKFLGEVEVVGHLFPITVYFRITIFCKYVNYGTISWKFDILSIPA